MAEPDSETPPIERNLGTQPLETLMVESGVTNHEMVAASGQPLTHKAVQRARKGRRLTGPMKKRIADAFNAALIGQGKAPERPWKVADLFTY